MILSPNGNLISISQTAVPNFTLDFGSPANGTSFDWRVNAASGDVLNASFTFDFIDPSAIITSPTEKTLLNNSVVTLSGTATDAASAISKVEIRVDGGTLQPAILFGTTSWIFISASLSDGNHTFEVIATDGAGNTSPSTALSSISVNIDTFAPTFAAIYLGSGTGNNTHDNPMPFQLTFNEPVSGLAINDFSVSEGGAVESVIANSSTVYTVNMTPADANLVSAPVLAIVNNAVTDIADNGNLGKVWFTY